MLDLDLPSLRPSESQQLEAKLEALLLGNRLFVELERQFDVFCPFESMGVIRAEIRHASFLAYILNPFRPHGFGPRVLRALLLATARSARAQEITNTDLSPLHVHLLELDDAFIRREWRNIDLLITLERQKIVIAIELKIDSSQHSEQLKRYRNIVESEWPDWRHVYVFLTKNDEDPEDSEHWISVRLIDVVAEIEFLLEQDKSDSDAYRMLRSYVQMLRRRHLSDERLREIAQKLWAEHGEALDFLMSARPDALADLLNEIRKAQKKIAEAVSTASGQLVPDVDHPTIVRFAFAPWDALPGFLMSQWTSSGRFILFEIKRENNRLSAFMYLGPGLPEHRSIFFTLLSNQRLHRPKSRPGNDWMCIAKATLFEMKDNFDSDSSDAFLEIQKNFVRFAKMCVERYDSILRPAATFP